ncbi:hypothetical protein C8R45DRAFT_837008 [Mycena sanguinolenta]|nr:hypothetical protein C8R45DRAFT_837008 [Mycena sanguinolenta]
MCGVPKQHTDWMRRRYKGRSSRIVFDDYVSEPFEVLGGLDQGNAHSGIAYLIYNSDLADIPAPEEDEHGAKFVDDNTLVTVSTDFHETHCKIRDVVQCPGGVDNWAAQHNAKFGPAKYQLVDMS